MCLAMNADKLKRGRSAALRPPAAISRPPGMPWQFVRISMLLSDNGCCCRHWPSGRRADFSRRCHFPARRRSGEEPGIHAARLQPICPLPSRSPCCSRSPGMTSNLADTRHSYAVAANGWAAQARPPADQKLIRSTSTVAPGSAGLSTFTSASQRRACRPASTFLAACTKAAHPESWPRSLRRRKPASAPTLIFLRQARRLPSRRAISLTLSPS